MASRILVAEDDSDLRRALAYMLRRDGHDVIEVGEVALLVDEIEHARAQEPAPPLLVIADLRLGPEDALVALEQLASAGVCPAVILMSGAWSAEQQDRARTLGVIASLPKPFQFGHLRQLVRAFEQGTRSPLPR